MTTETDDPAFWLARAKAARDMAEQLLDEEMRDILGEIAKAYERVAGYVSRGSNELVVN
jgi:hypothetical protein